MKRSLLCLCILVFMSTGISLNALAVQDATGQAVHEVGKKIAFQGTLYENGEPVTGERNFTFSIEIDENTTWTETQENVSIVEGLYSVALGSVSPIPIDLFYGVEERELTVSLGSTVLGTTILYAPFSSNSSEQGNFIMETKSENDSTAINAEISGNLGKSFNTAISASAKTDSTNIAVYGASEASETNEKFQYGMWGESTSNNPNAWAHGVIGIGRTNGATAYGVRGQVAGSGSEFSAAMRGLNFIDATNGGVRYGGYFNTYNREGSPFDGESVGARGNGGGSLFNTGVIGEGFGAGDLNIGVKGIANGAAENWAGWFEGEVRSTGQMMVRNNEESASKFTISDIQALAHGPDEEVNAIMGMNWLNGGDQSVNRGALFIFGDTLERFNREGADIRRIELTARDNGVNGGSVGDFKLRAWDGEMFSASVETQEDGSNAGELRLASSLGLEFARVRKNEQNAGVLELRSKDDFSTVVLDSNGEKAGLIQLNDSLGRRSVHMYATPNGGGYMGFAASFPEIEESTEDDRMRTSFQLNGGQQQPWMNMINRNTDGTVNGRIFSGAAITGGIPAITITGETYGQIYARIQGGAANGGEISLDGPSTSNFWLGQKNWENSDLPFMAMRGAQQIIVDEEGNGYTPDGLSLEVARYGDGSDNGLINFYKIENNETKGIGLDYDGVNRLFNPTYTSYRGTQEIQDGNGNTYVPDALTLQVADYGDGSENGVINFTRIENNETKSISLDYNNVNSLFNPTNFRLSGTQEIQDGNGNSYVPDVLSLQVADYGNGIETGSISLSKIENNELNNIWLDYDALNNLVNPTYTGYRGTQEIQDGNGNTYVPDALTLQVADYGDGSENGVINFTRIENNETKSISLDYNSVNSLFNPTNFRLSGTQEIQDGNGNSFVPDALSFSVADYGNGVETGVISLSKIENNEEKNIYLDYDALNNLVNPTSASYRGTQEILDGNGELYVPDALSLYVADYGDGSENGVINLTRVENNETKSISLDYNNVNSLFNPTDFRLSGTQEIQDGNGNLFVPDALSFSVADYGNGVETGVINLSKIENNEAKNIYLDYDALNNLMNPNRLEVSSDDANENGSLELLPSSVQVIGRNQQGIGAILSVGRDDAGTEFGELNLSNTSGGGFAAGSRVWENNNQGGNLGYAVLRGTNNRWLITQNIQLDENAQEFGEILIGAENGSFINLIGNTGNIEISGSLNQSSDRRLKKNIKTLTSGLSIVNQLRGVRYNWKDESRTGNKIGFIAQEVEKVLPELVKTKENGFKGVNYAEMTAVLVEAVKELSKQIDELKSENASLKAEASKVQSLEERLSRIEALLTKPATVNADQK